MHWLTWGTDLQASPVLEPVQLGPGPAPSGSTWWSRDGQVRTCEHVPRGNRSRDRSAGVRARAAALLRSVVLARGA